MSKNSKAPEGSRFAKFFSRVSSGLKYVPPLDRAIVGGNTIPGGWRYVGHQAEDYRWLNFKGDSLGTRWPIPQLYKMVGVIAVEAAEMSSLLDSNPTGRQAVALRFGQAVVVGELAHDIQFADNPNNLEQSLVAARVGRGELSVTAGLWLPETGRMLIPDSLVEVDRVALSSLSKTIPVV
ncbi:MAG: hypothetical protein ABI220_04710 [Candidatus Saccharimonadales bacterium]